MGILGSFGQYERESISERVRMALAHCKARGSYVGGPVPAGLQVAGPSGNRRLQVHPQNGAIVAQAWKRCIAGESLSIISDWLNTTAVKTPKGLRWSKSTVAKLLERKAYVGRLVDQQTWDDAQVALDARRPQGRPGFGVGQRERTGRGADRIWLLAQIGRCAKCGSPLLGVIANGKSGKVYPYYRCSRRSRRGGCDAKELPALAWEKAVLAGLTGVVGTYRGYTFAFVGSGTRKKRSGQ